MIKAVAVFEIEGDPRGERVADRQVQRALQADVRIVAKLALDVAGVAAVDLRVGAVDDHRAAGGVLAREGALWAAQDLDAGDVVVGLFLEITWEGRDPVAIGDDAGAGLAVVLALADAADVEVVALAEVVDGQRGAHELQLVDRQHPSLLEVGAGEHGGGDRHRLQVLSAPFGGDDQLLHRRGVAGLGRFRGRLRMGKAHARQRQRQRRRTHPQSVDLHGVLPNRIRSALFGATCEC